MKPLLTRSRYRMWIAVYVLGWLAVLLSAPWIGGESLDVRFSFLHSPGNAHSVDLDILLYQRIPRVLLAALVGGALAVVGACFQVILRNPLAEPYTVGISGGCSLGAVIALTVPALGFSWGPFSGVQFFSLLGAAATLGFIHRLADRPEGTSSNTLLLAGVTVTILCGSLILFFRYWAGPHYLIAMDRWMMGGLEVVGYRELSVLLPFLLPGLGLLFSCRTELNHLALGEEMAAGHGVDVASVQQRIFWGGGLATAGVVSLAGPIGFVGLIVPHAVRRLSGFDHRVVLPASFFLGGAFLTLCDTLARVLVYPTEIPVGIITALVGGPIFIRILLMKK